MNAHFSYGDYIFCLDQPDYTNPEGVVWVEKLFSEKIYNARYSLHDYKFLGASVSLAIEEQELIQNLIKVNRKDFNFDRQLKYLHNIGKHIVQLTNSEQRDLLEKPFARILDFHKQVKLQWYLLDFQSTLDFNRQFVHEALAGEDSDDLLEAVKGEVQEFHDDTYDEYIVYHSRKDDDWHIFGELISKVYRIIGLPDFYIAETNSNRRGYISYFDGKYGYLSMPGEFIGTGDFIWLQE